MSLKSIAITLGRAIGIARKVTTVRPTPGLPFIGDDDPSLVQAAIKILPFHLSTAPGIMIWKLPTPPESALLEMAYELSKHPSKQTAMHMMVEISGQHLEDLLTAARNNDHGWEAHDTNGATDGAD